MEEPADRLGGAGPRPGVHPGGDGGQGETPRANPAEAAAPEGGDVTALHELVFIAQVALEGNTGRAYNAGDLVSCNVDGTDLVQISSDSTEVGFALVAGSNVVVHGCCPPTGGQLTHASIEDQWVWRSPHRLCRHEHGLSAALPGAEKGRATMDSGRRMWTAAILALTLGAGVAWAAGTAGTTDTAFGTSGLLEVRADRIAVDSDGDVLVAQGNHRDADWDYYWRIRRYDADGSVDTAFSEILLYASPSTQTASWIHGLGIDSQGRVLVAGERLIETTTQKGKKTRTTSKHAFVLRRYTNAGLLDTDFEGGEVVLGYYTENDAFSGLADLVVLPDDSVLVVGDGPVTTTTSAVAARRAARGAPRVPPEAS